MTSTSGLGSAAFVEVVTFGHIASGRSDDVNERVRLIDLLRQRGEHIVLRDAVVQSVRPGLPVVAEVDPLLISRHHIVLATVIEPANIVRLRQQVHRTELVDKVTHPVTLFVPPYRVDGLLHLAPEADVGLSLPNLLATFFPLTSVTILHELGTLRWKRPVVVVNGSVVQLACPSEAVRAEQAAPAAPPRSPIGSPDDAA
ncbi:MAG TPA: hypothetical protein VNM43_05810 [Dehalococcoidia bacterium]|nr:hypothetical protein [Dehalococcoidia bacterium]